MTTTDEFLAAILDELRAIRSRLVQAPPEPPSPGLRLVSEPAPAGPATGPVTEVPAPPPRHGKGASRDAWAAYADRLGITYPHDARQRDIIAAVDTAVEAS